MSSYNTVISSRSDINIPVCCMVAVFVAMARDPPCIVCGCYVPRGRNGAMSARFTRLPCYFTLYLSYRSRLCVAAPPGAARRTPGTPVAKQDATRAADVCTVTCVGVMSCTSRWPLHIVKTYAHAASFHLLRCVVLAGSVAHTRAAPFLRFVLCNRRAAAVSPIIIT